MSQKTKILFIYSHWQTFVEKDFELLSKFSTIEKLNFKLQKSFFSFFFYQLKGILELVFKFPKNDVFVIWFCDYHAFWSVLVAKTFGKKSIIMIGGFDAVALPDYDYGLFAKNNFRTKLAKWAFRNCDKIVAVDQSLIKGNNQFTPNNITGILNFVPTVSNKCVVIPTGYESEKWQNSNKKNQILTIALIKNQRVFEIKGIDLFLELVKKLPEYEFIIVGVEDMNLIPQEFSSLKNLKIHPILLHEKLREFYAESKVYTQFSLTEGLPNVLCEAMMSECVPVGSNVNGIPTAIGDSGFILNEKDVHQAIDLVKKAMNSSPDLGKKARQRIIENFSVELRAEKLKKLISDLVK